MRIAVDGSGRLISIDETNDRDKYYCPYCNQVLTLKKGNIRIHHFSHKKGSVDCTDSWNRSTNIYEEPNTWHNDWEDQFPKENREVRLKFGAIVHRGDIVVGNTVLELQHSPITSTHFNQRTEYYHSCECKVIWLFDYIEAFKNNELITVDKKIYISFIITGCNTQQKYQ